MKALLIKPFGKVEIINIKNDLETLQKLVDGYIEVIYIKEYALIVNEEGKLRNLDENLFNLVGNIVITKLRNNNFASLSEKDIEKIKGGIYATYKIQI